MQWYHILIIIASFLGANSIFYILIRGDMNNRFNDMNKRFNDINKRIDDLRDDMNKRFNTLEKPIGEIREDIRLIFDKIILNRKK